MHSCDHTVTEQDRAIAMDFATRLRSIETPEQAIAAAEKLLHWLHPKSSVQRVDFGKK